MEFLLSIQEWFIGSGIYKTLIYNGRYVLFLQGVGVTLLVSAFAIVLGIILGSITTYFKLSRFKILRGIAYVYVDVIRGTPAFCQLMVFYFVIFGVMWSFSTPSAIFIGILAFGINSGAYVSEVIRGGILSIDKGQTEAGRSLGLSRVQTMRYIVGPQALKNILPALSNEFINLIKETAVIGTITAFDLMKAAMSVMAITYDAAVPLLVAAIMYYIIIKFLTILTGKMEMKLRQSDVR